MNEKFDQIENVDKTLCFNTLCGTGEAETAVQVKN